MKINIYTKEGKEKGSIEAPEAIFGLKWNSDLVQQVVTSMESSARTPVAHTKDRSDVRGGGKKPWQQKGTGRARHGSKRSPIWKGGGVTFGPRNEINRERKVNKKMKAKALFTILSRKAKNNEIIFVDSISFREAKTKDASAIFTALGNVQGYEMLAKRIIGEYYFYNPAEIKLAIRMGLQGSLSKVYGKINPGNIMDWLAEYDQIRAGEIENQTRQNQDHYSTAAPHPKFAEMWAKQVEKKFQDKTIYPSLAAYCNALDKSYTELRKIIASECEKLIEQTDVGFDDFVNYVERRCLVELNDRGAFDVTAIIKEIELNWQISENFDTIDKIKVVRELKKETKENSLFRSMLGHLKTD
jgi:large subunit ribosomal protein L4